MMERLEEAQVCVRFPRPRDLWNLDHLGDRECRAQA